MKALTAEFYARPVLRVARALIGCTVVHDGVGGVIVETEAYHDSEPACHAFIGLTPRTRVLFGAPARAYVYRSYGIHALLNVVCEREGVGAAVLIRALEPSEGVERMRARRARPGAGRPPALAELCSGPGKLAQALDVTLALNDSPLLNGPLAIYERERGWLRPRILSGPRVGISKAAELPWRFCAAGNVNVSRPRPPGWGTARTH